MTAVFLCIVICLITCCSAYVNLALRKPASGYNIYIHANVTAGNAVDGRKSNLHGVGGECSISKYGQRTATWWVNLESICSIHDIRIYYRTDNEAWGPQNGFTARFLGFSIYISNTTNKLEGTLCYKDDDFTRSTIPAIFKTTCFVHGQYVIYYNERLPGTIYPTGYSMYALYDLCEVEVYGCPTPGFYGINCTIPCPNVNCRYCHIETGTCQGGCKPGYKGHQCELECQDGYFGENCARECPANCNNCNKRSGLCDLGCYPGWNGTYCTEKCDGYTFGENCSKWCGICKNNLQCNHINGTCMNGCEKGYQGSTCTKECQDGYFGENCARDCPANCKSCNKRSGLCDLGCHPGWNGTYCSEQCINNKYGDGCQTNCGHCLNMTQCHHVNGTCFNGCDPGYEGQQCHQVVSNKSEKNSSSTIIESEEITQATKTEVVEPVSEAESSACISLDYESFSESSPLTSQPKKGTKIAFDVLQRIQHEVLCCQKKHIKLQNKKIQKEIERSELETENIKLRNAKLSYEIEIKMRIACRKTSTYLYIIDGTIIAAMINTGI